MPIFKMGQYNCVCDRCGLEFKSSELIKDWQGLMVDQKCYEQRHPQDLIKIKPEKAIPEWVRPRPIDSYLLTLAPQRDLFMFYQDTTAGQDYVDPTYFAEDYLGPRVLLQMEFSRSFTELPRFIDTPVFSSQVPLTDVVGFAETVSLVNTQLLALADTTPLPDSGTMILFNYVDPSYFAEDYVGEYTLF